MKDVESEGEFHTHTRTKMIILFPPKKDFACCSKCVSLNPRWPSLSMTDGKCEDHPGFRYRVWGVKGCCRLSGYKTSLALSASAEALGHTWELLCPPGSCRSSPVNGLQVPHSPRRIAASAKVTGSPARTPATQVPSWTLQRTRGVAPASRRGYLVYLW